METITGMLLTMLVLCMTFWYIIYHAKRRRLYKLAAEFNGPRPLPFIGNALKCMVSEDKIVNACINVISYYKSPVRLWFGPHLLICIWNPDEIKTVLNSPHALAKPPYLYDLLEPIGGRGLVLIPVNEWKRHRRLLNPNFNQQNLQNFFNVFCANSRELVDNMQREVGRGTFDVTEYLTLCTLNNILGSVLDFQLDAKSIMKTRTILAELKVILVTIMYRVSNILYFSDFIFNLTPASKKCMEAKQNYETLINAIIHDWKEHSLKKLHSEEELVEGTGSAHRKGFVQLLLTTAEEKEKLTDKELHDEVYTIIITGLETTATGMGSVLLMLGLYPEVQEKAYQEVLHALGTRKQLEWEDLPKLEYLERIIKETLRLFPIVGGVFRRTDRDIKLEKRIIPAGSNILVGILPLHRNPDIWPNPDTFDPDRFLPAEEAKRHPYCWIPFSAGARNCIGIRYALMFLKIMTAHLLLNYTISTPYKDISEIHLTMQLVVKATKGYKIGIKAR